MTEIERSKQTPFGRVLYALGLPGIGYVNANAIADHFGSIDALLEADVEAITEVEGIGPVLAESLVDELSEDAVRELISRLRERGLRFELSAAERRAEGGPLDGKTFVLTGTLPETQPRAGDEADPRGRRQGHRLGLEEHRLPRRGGQPGIQARQGRGGRDRDPGRGRPAEVALRFVTNRRPGRRGCIWLDSTHHRRCGG